MGGREWLSHHIFHILNPLGNLKIVDTGCEARYDLPDARIQASVCLFNVRAFGKRLTPCELAQDPVEQQLSVATGMLVVQLHLCGGW